jgi:serine/threonine protein kinase
MQQKLLNNRYELERKIGEGGMARVYLGRDTRLNRNIAVKVLHSHYASDPDFLQRFHHEAQAAANLRHPNIVDVYDVGLDSDIHYIVMEYVEGSDLKSLIRRNGPLPVDQAVSIAEAVALGLSAAHRQQLIHRDIKPQNIIVGPQGQVKITDFGIAKSQLSTAMTETGITFGTADYISPEQARGQPATTRSDIYALGITLYEMLTGRLPFTGDSAVAVAMQHVAEEPPPPRMFQSRIPPALEKLVLQTLSKDPMQRPATAQEFARLLSNWRNLNDQATVVRPSVPPVYEQQTQVAQRPPQQQQRPQVNAQSSTPRPAPVRNQPSITQPPRSNMPPVRPAISASPPPSSQGLGFGGFILGLLLLVGVLGLVYLFASGIFNDLFNFQTGTPPPITRTATPGIGGTAEPVPTETPVPMSVMPYVLNLSRDEAIRLIREQNLVPREDTQRYHESVPLGQVFDQFPAAGTSITSTNVVTFAISLGQDLITVPNVVSARGDQAERVLRGAGFNVNVHEEPHRNVEAGFVTRTSPNADTRLTRGETVDIYVSMGDKVLMPDVMGLGLDQARAAIEAAGLFVSFEDMQGPDKIPNYYELAPYTVVSSTVQGRSWVDRGTPVTLGVRAPEEAPSP